MLWLEDDPVVRYYGCISRFVALFVRLFLVTEQSAQNALTVSTNGSGMLSQHLNC